MQSSGSSPGPRPVQPAPLNRPWQQLRHLERDRSHNCIREGLPQDSGVRGPKIAQPEELVQPHEDYGVQHRGREEDHETRRRLGHNELRSDHAGQEPDDGLGQTTDAYDADRERVLNKAGESPGQQSCHRTEEQRDVHDDDQHQIDRSRTAQKTHQRGLQSQSYDSRHHDSEDPHGRAPCGGASFVDVGEESTTSTCSRLEKSTAGTMPICHALPVLSMLSIRPMTSPLG